MYLIPHSYPNITINDRTKINECIEKEYVGYDEELSSKIYLKLKKYLGFQNLELVPSGTIALLLILKYLKLKKKDEIIISAINCWSVYNTIKLENGIPVICDVKSKDDFRASYESIVNSITQKTKMIIVTHMYGNLIKEKDIKRLKKQFPHIYILEDFSTSLFSKKDIKIGKFSDFGIGSFGSTKPLTGGIGGILCSHKELFSPQYDTNNNTISLNTKISRLNQALLLSQINDFYEYQLIKSKLVKFYAKYINIYKQNSDDLFRVITFKKPKKLIKVLNRYDIKLDIRQSVQPNLAKELRLNELKNSYNFKKYYSIPFNIKAYNILHSKGLL